MGVVVFLLTSIVDKKNDVTQAGMFTDIYVTCSHVFHVFGESCHAFVYFLVSLVAITECSCLRYPLWAIRNDELCCLRRGSDWQCVYVSVQLAVVLAHSIGSQHVVTSNSVN